MKCIFLSEELFESKKHFEMIKGMCKLNFKNVESLNIPSEEVLDDLNPDDFDVIIRTAGFELHRLYEKGIKNDKYDYEMIDMVDDNIFVYEKNGIDELAEEYGMEWEDFVCGELNSWYSYLSIIEVE